METTHAGCWCMTELWHTIRGRLSFRFCVLFDIYIHISVTSDSLIRYSKLSIWLSNLYQPCVELCFWIIEAVCPICIQMVYICCDWFECDLRSNICIPLYLTANATSALWMKATDYYSRTVFFFCMQTFLVCENIDCLHACKCMCAGLVYGIDTYNPINIICVRMWIEAIDFLRSNYCIPHNYIDAKPHTWPPNISNSEEKKFVSERDCCLHRQ